jgi:hypothetical protein
MHHYRNLKSVALVALLMALVALPALAAEDTPAEPKPLVVTLERLGELLARLDAQLGSTDRPATDRIEERVAEAGDLVEGLLASLEASAPSPREQAAKLDITLHRLIAMLEEIVGGSSQRPERERARMTLEELRAWVDGYVAASTAGMSSRDAERFGRAAHDLARALAAQLAKTAKRAEAPQPGIAKLSAVVERLDALTQRLDALLLRMLNAPETNP